ncbi:putative membrane protein [Weissella uvarum]|uniref:YibE/F family protein n=1 Tax=Weissella uvarum TaxID=1479233 RepID=UPI00195FF9E1|nr:YibE/F family protein [Weissella uvarum]MBM7617472.1 putative membrane protein [Weissella uvarum]MCM0595643.1 YibE/F family protein [Weissella uvarum]
MNVTIALAIILLILMVLIAGAKGLGAFVSLWINFLVLACIITLISFSFNPFWVLLIGGGIILTITIISTGSDEDTTRTALTVSFIVMLLLLVLIVPMEQISSSAGFSVENSEELEGLSLGINVPFKTLGICAALLATLGAIAEAAVAISSSLAELQADQPRAKLSQLISAGQQVGREIVGTAVNTVLFGYLADFLSLSLLFTRLNYSFTDIINTKLFTSALLSLMYSILGVVLVFPFTLLVFYLQHKKQTTNQDENA